MIGKLSFLVNFTPPKSVINLNNNDNKISQFINYSITLPVSKRAFF